MLNFMWSFFLKCANKKSDEKRHWKTSTKIEKYDKARDPHLSYFSILVESCSVSCFVTFIYTFFKETLHKISHIFKKTWKANQKNK